MQNTTNLNLKKPEYTDFADIQDINDNMDILDGALHDTQNSVATFASSDTADGSASSWTTVPALASGETHKSLFAKMSQMFKNVRYLYKLLGTTDISSIGDGTVTKALSVLNAKQYKVIANRTINLSAYGQASLGISSITNIIVSVQTIEYVINLLVEDTSVYNYWVQVKRQDGSLVTNTSIKVSIVYFEL